MEGTPAETILVVEDNDPVRRLVCLVLRSSGYLVLEAQDGQEALALSRQHKGTIHLLVADLGLPRLGGRELAVRMLADRVDLKVLFLSGSNDRIAVEEVQFLYKPFTVKELLEATRTTLEAERNP